MPTHPREVDQRKPPMLSRWTRNRRRLEMPETPPPPPPEPDYVVTGEITPDATGDYYEDGTHDGEPKYRREDSAFWIYYTDALGCRVIYATVHDDPPHGFFRYDGFPGDYDGVGDYVGTATVQLP